MKFPRSWVDVIIHPRLRWFGFAHHPELVEGRDFQLTPWDDGDPHTGGPTPPSGRQLVWDNISTGSCGPRGAGKWNIFRSIEGRRLQQDKEDAFAKITIYH